jgi:hypothetical protein
MESGVVIVSQREESELVCVYFCFDPVEGNPYPQAGVAVNPFEGVLDYDGWSLRIGMSEEDVLRDPRVAGVAGILSVRLEQLHVGIRCKRARNRGGRRSGPRVLVDVSAGWGRVGFATTSRG